MIPALFALAAAMTIAGAAAVIEGFPYVRLESGMAMVHGGAVLGSAGLLMFGLGVVAAGLKRIERAVGAGVPIAAPAPAAPADVIDPFADPLLAPVPVPAAAPERPRIEPAIPGGAETANAVQPELPLPGLTAPPVTPPRDEREPEPAPAYPAKVEPAEEDLFVPSRPAPIPPYTPPSLGSSYGAKTEPSLGPSSLLRPGLDTDLDDRPAATPAPSLAAPKVEEPDPADRTVVGRYSSGGNTYLMFSDGAIEADTPNGRFTFASLDELKAFVDGGGESGTRGAA